MATLPVDYEDASTPTGAKTELPATTTRGLNAITAQVNANTLAITGKYAKPGGGIPFTDLASAVQIRAGTAFSTADYPNADDRVCVANTVAAACAQIVATETDQTVVIHAPMTFATGSTFGPLVGSADPNASSTSTNHGVHLPVNLTAGLHIVFAPGAKITLSADCHNAFLVAKEADYDVFQNVSFYNAWVDGNNIGRQGSGHALVGNMTAPNTASRYLSFQDINFYGRTRFTNFYHSDTWDADPDSAAGQVGIMFVGGHNDALESTQTFTKNIYLQDGDQEGGRGLFNVTGGAASGAGGTNHYHDNIVVDRYRFVNPTTPTVSQPETGIFICGPGFGGYCYIGPGYVENIGDDAIEVGAMQRVEIVSLRSKNPFLAGILIRHTHAPLDVASQRITIRGMDCHITDDAGGAVPLMLTSDGGAATPIGTVVVENPRIHLDGVAFTSQGNPDGMLIAGLDQYVRSMEVIRPTITITDYTFDGSGYSDIGLYHPQSPAAGWGMFLLRDSELILGGTCDFGDFAPNAAFFYEVMAEGTGTVVDIDGMITDYTGTNGTGQTYQVSVAKNSGSNVKIRARRLFPRVMSSAPSTHYGVQIYSGGTLAQCDVVDSDFSNLSDFDHAVAEYSGGGNLAKVRTARNLYNGASTLSKVFGLPLDAVIGTGSPEGVVTANVGSRFVRTDGDAGTYLYVKLTGTGNTGWVGI